MAKYEVVLFDVDGTLIDSAPGIFETMRYTFEAMHEDISGVDLHRYLGPPLRKIMAGHFAEDADVEKSVQIYRSHYAEVGSKLCSLYPGVTEMLLKLNQHGILCCTATSKPDVVAAAMLQNLGVAEQFAVIGGAAMDKSRDTKTLVIQYLLNLPQLAGKSFVMIGDRKEDILAAKECGIPSVGAGYGYAQPGELEAAGADWIFNDCGELADFLLS